MWTDLGHTMRLKDRQVYLVNDQGNECMCLISHTLTQVTKKFLNKLGDVTVG